MLLIHTLNGWNNTYLITWMTEICQICDRKLGTDINEHHLVPKTFKGRDKITLHRLCHDQLHHSISERDMLKYYNTVERLREHEDISKFREWVKNKHPDFYIMIRDTKQRNRQR